MASSDLRERDTDLSKKDRIINAWLAVGLDAKAKHIAEVTDASLAYASRIASQMEANEISEDDVAEIRDEALIEAYGDQLAQFTQQEHDAAAMTTEETDQSAETESANDGVTDQSNAQHAGDEGEQQTHHLPQHSQQPSHHDTDGKTVTYEEPLLADSGGTVATDQLRELDELLAMYEEEAQFERHHLSPQDAATAVGKLFIIQQTRSKLREIVTTQ